MLAMTHALSDSIVKACLFLLVANAAAGDATCAASSPGCPSKMQADANTLLQTGVRIGDDLAPGRTDEKEQKNTYPLTQQSTESFGDGGPTVRACPWYKWDQTGSTMLPRGPSTSHIHDRQQTLQAKMNSFRAGGDFIIVKGGTELNAHVGGPQNQGNDIDLDARVVSVTPDGLGLLSTEVKLDAKGMPAGGYGQKTISTTGQETKQFIENKLCLCVAGGMLTLCEVHPDLSRYGETYWLPLPNSKNLGLGYLLWTYIDLAPAWDSWRDNSIEDLKTWDGDGNGEISFEEVMTVAPSKGVLSAWLELMQSSNPCELVNAAISANFSLHLCQDIRANKAGLESEFKNAGLWPPNTAEGKAFAKNKYGVQYLEDNAVCNSMISR